MIANGCHLARAPGRPITSHRTLRHPSKRYTSSLCRSAAVAAKPRPFDDPSIQLGTAAIPNKVEIPAFVDSLYQWAATLSQSGANYPTVLPLKVDKLDTGFKISLLKRLNKAGFDSAGDIQVTVEDDKDVGKCILFIRFYEGPASLVDRRTPAPSDTEERLNSILASLVDVDTIMQTMPNAIFAAVKASSPA